MAEVIQFRADTSDADAVVSLLEAVLERAKAGQVMDIAVATVERDEDGEPMSAILTYGEAQYMQLLGAVTALQHALCLRPYVEE